MKLYTNQELHLRKSLDAYATQPPVRVFLKMPKYFDAWLNIVESLPG